MAYVQAQLFTVPPYAVALVFMLLMTTFSDRYQTRALPAASVFIIGIVGWTILLTVNAHKPTAGELHARYFGCICVVTAGYTNIPIIICKSCSSSAEAPADEQRGYLETPGTSLKELLDSVCSIPSASAFLWPLLSCELTRTLRLSPYSLLAFLHKISLNSRKVAPSISHLPALGCVSCLA